MQVCAYDAMLMILTMLFTLQVWLKHNAGGEGGLESEVIKLADSEWLRLIADSECIPLNKWSMHQEGQAVCDGLTVLCSVVAETFTRRADHIQYAAYALTRGVVAKAIIEFKVSVCFLCI